MLYRPFRFVHAANVRLDHQLEQIGAWPESTQEVIRDATYTAFRELVAACIEHDADFLLLTGNTFVAQDRSLWGSARLAEGFGQLAERDISVFVLPGADDPMETWSSLRLPDNVTVLATDRNQSVTVACNDRHIATLRVLTAVDRQVRAAAAVEDVPGTASGCSLLLGCDHDHMTDQESVPQVHETTVDRSHDLGLDPNTAFTIGLVSLPPVVEQPRNDDIHQEQRLPDPMDEWIGQLAVDASVDYVALGGEDQRFSGTYRHCLIHSPGTTQARHSADTGPKGATLVQIAGDRTISTSFLPTAPVRWERLRIGLPASASEDELLQRMRAEMERLHVERSEKVRILQWTVCFEQDCADTQTSSTMAAVLGTWTERERLQDRINRELGQCDDVVCLHRLGFPVPSVIDCLGPDETITRQLLHELEQQSLEAHTVRQCLERAKRIQADAAERLEDVGAGIDGDQIVKRAHAEVMNWLYALRQAG